MLSCKLNNFGSILSKLVLHIWIREGKSIFHVSSIQKGDALILHFDFLVILSYHTQHSDQGHSF